MNICLNLSIFLLDAPESYYEFIITLYSFATSIIKCNDVLGT